MFIVKVQVFYSGDLRTLLQRAFHKKMLSDSNINANLNSKD